MGQKVNPNSLRLGYIKGWESNWFSSKKGYADKLIEDHKIRKYLGVRMAKANLSKIVIERTLKRITITVHSSKPGIIIGKGGAEVERIKEELRKLTAKEVHINILEIKRPELDAKLVANSIAQQIQARISYKRVVKQALAATMRVGAQGIKISTSGRLGGAEIARSEQFKEGRIPLHTLRADIDYALGEAQTVYGKIGIKVWIFKNEIYQRPDLSSNSTISTGSESNKGTQKNTFKGRAKN
ncbi:MAG: 30S ribosomal protein S3 [Candidatus Amoebophilus sp. 36-38]|nr:MAG: 30S ribosomal protein S3 [Candidatus Amoebophilus sp. 36-38]